MPRRTGKRYIEIFEQFQSRHLLEELAAQYNLSVDRMAEVIHGEKQRRKFSQEPFYRDIRNGKKQP